MTPRLMHTKSRAGCTRCKSRKVKCDENKPVCGACKKHGVDCLYPPTPPPSTRLPPQQHHQQQRRRSRTPTTTVTANTSGRSDSTGSLAVTVNTLIPGVIHDDHGVSLPESRERRMLELRMMQLYMRSFRDMFAGIHSIELVDVWQNTVPALALHYPFLLHAMFAITALHFIVTNGGRRADGWPLPTGLAGPDMARAGAAGDNTSKPTALDLGLPFEKMEEVRVLYFNLAIGGHRKAISNLNAENADSICICTILISNTGFLLTHDFNPDAATYAPPVNWLWLASGIHTMIAETTPMLSPDSATMRLIQNVSGDNMDEEKDQDTNGAFFSPLLDHERTSESDEDMDVYRRVVNLVGLIRVGVLRGETAQQRLRKTLGFASLVPTEFITFVSEHRPRALTILACFFAMSKENEHIWWFSGAAETHVLGLKTLLPTSWLPMLTWSLQLIKTSATERMILWQKEKIVISI